MMDNDIYKKLATRIGEEHLSKRMIRQVDLAAKFYAKGGYASFHLENTELVYVILKYLLKAMGIYQRGLDNALDYKVEVVNVFLEKLPPQFEGFKILQLSDIHADVINDNGQKLIHILNKLEFDLCVITGDFRFLTQDIYDKALERTAQIVRAVNAPYGIFGILGNHDFIEFVPGLESSGIKMLLNEAVPVWVSNSEMSNFCPDQGRTRVCGEAYACTPHAGLFSSRRRNPAENAEQGKKGHLWMDTRKGSELLKMRLMKKNLLPLRLSI